MTHKQKGTRGHLSLVPALSMEPEHEVDPQARRRPRRSEPATYTLRVALEDVEPQIWRRFTVASDTMLDELHPILQTVMGWKDAHLHTFISASAKYSEDALRFEMREAADDDDHDELSAFDYEDTARIDELLADAGDLLFYEYDFGDGWDHVITLEQIGEPTPDLGPVCIDGERRCPPEDVGGAFGYARLLAALADPLHADHRDMRAWAGTNVDPEKFSVKKVNRRLRRHETGLASYPQPGTLAGRLLGMIPENGAPKLYAQLENADLGSAPEVTAADAKLATSSLRWLLEQIGDDGLALTAAGQLPAAVVKLARTDLGWERPSGMVGNREADCPELRSLRKAAVGLGLARTQDGRLLATTQGDALSADPARLFAHIAKTLPVGEKDRGFDAAAILLVLLAGGASPENQSATIAQALAAMQWCYVGPRVRPSDVDRLVGPTMTVLRGIGAIGPDWGRELVRASVTRMLR